MTSSHPPATAAVDRLGPDRAAALATELAPLGLVIVDRDALAGLEAQATAYQRLRALVDDPGDPAPTP